MSESGVQTCAVRWTLPVVARTSSQLIFLRLSELRMSELQTHALANLTSQITVKNAEEELFSDLCSDYSEVILRQKLMGLLVDKIPRRFEGQFGLDGDGLRRMKRLKSLQLDGPRY